MANLTQAVQCLVVRTLKIFYKIGSEGRISAVSPTVMQSLTCIVHKLTAMHLRVEVAEPAYRFGPDTALFTHYLTTLTGGKSVGSDRFSDTKGETDNIGYTPPPPGKAPPVNKFNPTWVRINPTQDFLFK